MLDYILIWISINIIILIHEYGHFSVARLNNIRVEIFSVGLGKAIWSYQIGETTIQLGWIPLGGYVQLYSNTHDTSESNYLNAYWYQKVCILLAGPMINLFAGILCLWLALSIGIMQVKPIIGEVIPESPAATAGLEPNELITYIDGKSVDSWTDVMVSIIRAWGDQTSLSISTDHGGQHRLNISNIQDQGNMLSNLGLSVVGYNTIIKNIAPLSPAESGGLQLGDRIIKINQKPVEYWEDLQQHIQQQPNQTVDITILRDETIINRNILLSEKYRRGYLGIEPEMKSVDISTLKFGGIDAISESIERSFQYLSINWVILQKLITGSMSLDALTGPIGLFSITKTALNTGTGEFFYLLAMINLALFFFNLLPIPGLDGSLILLTSIESILSRKYFSLELQALLIRIGMVGLLVLAFQISINDVLKIYQQ